MKMVSHIIDEESRWGTARLWTARVLPTGLKCRLKDGHRACSFILDNIRCGLVITLGHLRVLAKSSDLGSQGGLIVLIILNKALEEP